MAAIKRASSDSARGSTQSRASQEARNRSSTASNLSSGRGSIAEKELRKAQKDRIQVSVRARPLNSREQGNKVVWKFAADSIEELKDDGVTPTGSTYAYDHVFAPEVGTLELYNEQSKHIVQGALEGYNGTIFAYGQTSSGKTFTLTGEPGTNPGISLLAFDDVFRKVGESRGQEWGVHISYLEIYNENVTDLLQTDANAGKNMKIYEDKMFGPRVRGVVELAVTSPADCLQIFLQGEKMRHYAATGMNDTSSRSHTIFQMRIESKCVAGVAQEESAGNMRDIAVKFQSTQGRLTAERATLYVVDRTTSELHSQAGEIIISLPMSQGLAGACATTGETLLIDDVYNDPRFNSSHDKKTGFRSRSMCIVPIKNEGNVIAVAQFLNKVGGHAFDATDRQRAEDFAQEAAPLMASAQANARESSSGLLNLIDLAGSERVGKTGSQGSVLKEAGYINKSLMNLGVCIFALSEGKAGHIPFRDSKLTMLLASSLGGNARTAIICNISPASRNRNESISTLQFASRAKKIFNKVQQNVWKDQAEVLGQYMAEVSKLKNDVQQAHAVYECQISELKAELLAEKEKDKQPMASGGVANGPARQSVAMTEEFKSRTATVKMDVLEAETITNALAAPIDLRVSLRVVILTPLENMSDMKRVVQVGRLPKLGAEPLSPEWISEEEFYYKLALLKRMQLNVPGSAVDVDLWNASRSTMTENKGGTFSPKSAPTSPGKSDSAMREPTLDEVRRFRTELTVASRNLEQVRVELDELELRKLRQIQEGVGGGYGRSMSSTAYEQHEMKGDASLPSTICFKEGQLRKLQELLQRAGCLLRVVNDPNADPNSMVSSDQIATRLTTPHPDSMWSTSSVMSPCLGSSPTRIQQVFQNGSALLPLMSCTPSQGSLHSRPVSPVRRTPSAAGLQSTVVRSYSMPRAQVQNVQSVAVPCAGVRTLTPNRTQRIACPPAPERLKSSECLHRNALPQSGALTPANLQQGFVQPSARVVVTQPISTQPITTQPATGRLDVAALREVCGAVI